MKTKRELRRELEAEQFITEGLNARLIAQQAAAEQLAEAHRAEVEGLKHAYNDLHKVHYETMQGDHAEIMLDETVKSLQDSNERMSDMLGRILGIVLNGEDPDEVDSDPA